MTALRTKRHDGRVVAAAVEEGEQSDLASVKGRNFAAAKHVHLSGRRAVIEGLGCSLCLESGGQQDEMSDGIGQNPGAFARPEHARLNELNECVSEASKTAGPSMLSRLRPARARKEPLRAAFTGKGCARFVPTVRPSVQPSLRCHALG